MLVFAAGCSQSDQLDATTPPAITFGEESLIYSLKVGESLTLTPTVENGDGASYAWSLDGVLVCEEPSCTLSFESNGTYYLSLLVTSAAGDDVADIRIDVSPLSPPTISLLLPSDGVVVLCGAQELFEPTFTGQDAGGFECRWYLSGELVCEDVSYLFSASQVGLYSLRIEASNIDGEAEPFTFDVEVVDQIPYSVSLDSQSLTYSDAQRSTFVERPLHLSVSTKYFESPQFSWYLDGELLGGASEESYIFTASSGGDYTLSVVVQESSDAVARAEASISIFCADGAQSDYARSAEVGSLAEQSAIYEYFPAPGQYIGDSALGFSGEELTHAAALSYAEQRLASAEVVSLGGFGGYIVVGFDHSVVNRTSEYDFAIYGNAFDGGSEPGVVWVMQDLNGNGEPDDQWYELRGSQSEDASTIQEYEVTYYRPTAAQQSVEWLDSEGESGTITYYGAYHSQDSYYPLWGGENSYTLRGTRLEPRNIFLSGIWDLQSYDWGYADNDGDDQISAVGTLDGAGQANLFNIENAMQPDLSAVEVEYIDFIKVQCAVNATSGTLGEVSTEVAQFVDLSLVQ